MRSLVVGVDIGSVRQQPSEFAWAAIGTSGNLTAGGIDPESAVQAITQSLSEGKSVALCFEAPLSIPVPLATPEAWTTLGRARSGEGNRAWSAGAGAGALATGLAQGAWICERLATLDPQLSTTTQWPRWRSGEARLLIAEALVSGHGKPVAVQGNHAADAQAAALALAEALRDDEPRSDVQCTPESAFNLGATMALRAGLRISPDELRMDILVVRAKPVPTD